MKDLKHLLEGRAGRAEAAGSERLRQRVVVTLAAQKGGGLTPQPRRRYSGPLIGLATATVVLIGIGVAGLLFLPDSESPAVEPSPTNPAPPVSVTQLTAVTTVPPDSDGRVLPLVDVPPVTSGTWTVYGPLPGLTGGPLLLAVDGNGDVFAVSQETGDVISFVTSGTSDDGPQDVSPVPDQIRGRWIYWMVGLPDGGLLYGYAATNDDNEQLLDAGGVIGFDGSEWFSPTLPDGTPLVLRGVSAAEVGKDGAVWIADFGDDQMDAAPRLFHFADGAWAEWAAPASIVGAGGWNAGSRVSLAADGALWSVIRAEDGTGGAARQYGEVIDFFDFGRSGDTCCLAWVQAAPNGDVWVHADVGVDRYRDGEWIHFDTDDNVTAHPDVYAIPTSDGSLWLQDEFGQVSHFDGRDWYTYTSDERTALAIPAARPVARLTPFSYTSDGTTWALTYEGLYRHDGTSWSRIDPPPDIDLSRGSLVVTPEGHAWVTSGEDIVARFEPQP